MAGAEGRDTGEEGPGHARSLLDVLDVDALAPRVGEGDDAEVGVALDDLLQPRRARAAGLSTHTDRHRPQITQTDTNTQTATDIDRRGQTDRQTQ